MSQYTDMLENRVLNVTSDTRPWGGVSPIFDLDARVDSMSRNIGAVYDTATLIFYDEEFGSEQTFFLPVRITDDATSAVLYRGFIVSNEGTINANGESMSVECVCYKWLLSKRSMLRGKWYLNKGEISAPAGGMGSGISAGDAKYTYEKFRSDLQSGSGYLQNEQLVFNQGGSPDCFLDNLTTGTTLAFYFDTEDDDETMGLPDTRFAPKSYAGYYWTWLTIIRYIHTYFIDPYNVVLAPVNLDSTDLTALRGIAVDLRQPINYSLDGYNPLTALDYVVSSIPGRWYWYMEYTSTTSTIRIKELDDSPADEVQLTLAPKPNLPGTPQECLPDSNANVTSVTVKRDGSAAVANVVGLGGKVKLITTVKLVPTWPRYDIGGGVISDFKSEADFIKWRKWAIQEYKLESNDQTATKLTLTGEQLTRYPLIYRVYGVPMEGELFGTRIVSEDPGTAIDAIDLDGDVGTHYTNFTVPGGGGGATFRDFFFQNARVEREVSPPEFERYSDKVQVFLYDPQYTNIISDKAGSDVIEADRGVELTDNPNASQKTAENNRRKWIIPDIDKVSYNFDEKNMMVVFDDPQCQQKNTKSLSNKDRFAKTIKEFTYDTSGTQLETRSVYMTATFATDLAAVFGSRITAGFVEAINGAPFSAYVKARNQDIIYHKNAWYPQTQLNKSTTNPIDSTDLMDGKTIGDAIIRCDTFSNYREYVGEGHYELGRAILNWKEGYLNYREEISAELPYMELNNNLGDGLIAITNSAYIGIASFLVAISWRRVGDSDNITTSYSLNNFYSTNKNNIDFAPLKHDENKNRFNKRIKFSFDNEVPSGDLPPI